MRRSRIRWLFAAFLILLSSFLLLKVKNILSPFLLGMVIAYILSPSVFRLERKGIKRNVAVALVFIFIAILLALIIFLLLPILYLELGKIIAVLPGKVQALVEYVQNTKSFYSQAGLPSEVSRLIDQQLLKGQTFLLSRLEGVLENLPQMLTSAGLIILAPILAIYYLLDWPKISEGLLRFVPGKKREGWGRILQEIDSILQGYIQGNIIDGIIVGILIGLGVRLIGMEYALLIGVICAVTNIIPYFGPFLGAVPSAALALSKSPLMAVKVALVIFIVQQIDGNIINPKLMSRKVGLHPLWVVLALLAGGEFGGLLGMFLAIPAAAIIRILFREVYNYLVAPDVRGQGED